MIADKHYIVIVCYETNLCAAHTHSLNCEHRERANAFGNRLSKRAVKLSFYDRKALDGD